MPEDDCSVVKKKSKPPLNITHGFSRHDGTKLPEYAIWQAMKNRCLNPLSKMYRYYGARGITVYLPWQTDFVAFLDHIGRRPDKSLTLDRLDNSKGYEPGNVGWRSRGHQVRNRRNNWNITLDGVTRCATDWAEFLGISISFLYYRKKHGITDPRELLATTLRPVCCLYCQSTFTPNAANQTICANRECHGKRQRDYRSARLARRAAA